MIPLAQLDELRSVEREVVEVHLGELARDVDELLRFGERQRPKHHTIDDAEDRRVRADAEREGQHRGEREHGDAREAARRLPELLRDLMGPVAAPHVARRLAHGGLIAEPAPRVSRRVLRRFAARDAVADRHVEVSLHLAVQIARTR